MTQIEIYEKLNKIFRKVFDDDKLVISDKTTASDIEEWDSLNHITLISEIEEEFNCEFNMMDVLSINSVKEMADRIEELL